MESNMTLTLGFKGQGKPNGVPAYTPNGVWTLGGYQDPTDTQVAKFGIVMGSDPSGSDGDFYCGAISTADVASVYNEVITVSGTTVPAATNINVDGTVISIASGVVAATAVGLIASGIYYRWTTAISGTTAVVFTAKSGSYASAPVYTDGNPKSNILFAQTVVTSGTIGKLQRGITLYDAGVAENDPAKANYMLQGAPITLMYQGQVWLQTWIGASTWGAPSGTTYDSSGVVCTGATASPTLSAVVCASNVTGEIGLLPSGTGVPTGYTAVSAVVKSVSTDTNGIMLYITM